MKIILAIIPSVALTAPAAPMRLLLLLAPLLSLSACTAHRTGRPTIAAEELATLLRQPPSKPEMIAIHFTVSGNRGQKMNGPLASYAFVPLKYDKLKKAQSLPGITVRPNQKAKIEIIREFIYPTRLELPKIPRAPAQLTPTTPTQFKTVNVGWTVDDITAIPTGAFYLVYGRFIEITFDGFTDNPGAGFRPIMGTNGRLLTDNRSESPTFTTRETPFVICASPGQVYRLPLHLRQPGAVLEVSSEGVDRSGQPTDSARLDRATKASSL